MSLYQKYRPKELSDIVGNSDVIDVIHGDMQKSNEDMPHAFLLTGPTGCGKTTIARIIAKTLGATGMDLCELDSAQFGGVDRIREIRDLSKGMPLQGFARVFILDECHMLSKAAQNALLKALEDTPGHVYYILATTDPRKLIATIKGRCSKYDLKPLNDKQMKRLLKRVVKGEKEKLSTDIYESIIDESDGRPREALQILDQVLAVDPEKRAEVAEQSRSFESESIELCRALLNQNTSWKAIRTILVGLKGQDPEGVRRLVLGYCQSVLLKGADDRAFQVMELFLDSFWQSGFPGLTHDCYSVKMMDA